MTITEEQLELRALAREFAAGELRPHTARWDAQRGFDDDLADKLSELGFFGMRVPEEHGGLGLDVPTYLTVLEQISWGDASVALDLSIHNGPVVQLLVEHGTDDQRSQWLPGMGAGSVLGAFALSESGAGSDAAAMETRAERTDAGWRIQGRKRWVTNGRRAGVVAVFARTGAGPHDLSVFLVDPSTPGYEVAERERTLGLCATETVSVGIDLTVPAEAMIGEEGRAFRYAMSALEIGRLGVAAQSLGLGQAALEHSIEYARGREQFNRPIAEFGAIQERLANVAIRLSTARALTGEAAIRLQQSLSSDTRASEADLLSVGATCAAAKVAASETAMFAADEAVQIFGGYGYMRDYPVEKLMRDAKGTEIYEGSSEILRWIIARDLLQD